MQSGTTWNSKYAYMNQPSAIGSTVVRFDLGANFTLDSTDTYYFYHYDEAGNVILITDKNGNVVDHFEQDAWGNDLNNTFNTARSIAQHQTSKFYDTTTGLYFFGARWYYPEIGRFISVSPLAPTGEEEYVYCNSDAINLVDFNGLFSISAIWDEFTLLVAPVYNPIHKKWIAARDYTSDVVYKFLDPKLHSIEMYGQRYNQFLLDPANPEGGLVNRKEICNHIAEDINTRIAFTPIFGMARKFDLGQIDHIALKLGLSKRQRDMLHQTMRKHKLTKNMSVEEIMEFAEDVKKMYPNK